MKALIQTVQVPARLRRALVILSFLPLLFISNRSSHDWGDDFAQYIHQAKNIVQGTPQAETGFLFSKVNYIGPRAYPAGFPLMLAPVYALAGNNMQAFTFFISCIYFVLALLLVLFFRKYFALGTAWLLTALWLYNPQMLIFKQEVMSDLPFTLLLVAALVLYDKILQKGWWHALLFGLLAGFMISVRSIGMVFLLAIAADQLIQVWQDRKDRTPLKKSLASLARPALACCVALLTWFTLNNLIFRIPGGSMRDYLDFYYAGNFMQTIPANFEHYVEVFRYMYIPQAEPFRGIALITGAAFLVLACIGFLTRMVKAPALPDIFFILYTLLLLVFPDYYSAFRLMVPVGFMLLYYAALGFGSVKLSGRFSHTAKVAATGLFMLLLFLPGIVDVARGARTILPGPQEKESAEAFSAIRELTPEGAVIVFAKPRALALYTDRSCMADPRTANIPGIHADIMQAGATHLLLHGELTAESMERYVKVMGKRLQPVWKNGKFTLLKAVPPNPAAPY